MVRSTALAGPVAAVGAGAAVLGLLLPWLGANPPAGLTFSNSPYTDEGLYNSAGRDLVMFGSFGHAGLFRQLTNPAYVLADSAVFAVAGPSIAAARVLSVASVCAMVVILLWGLPRLVGLPAAVVAAAGVAGSPIVLLYGHIGIIEPFEAAMLVAGFTLVARGVAAERWIPGAIGGLFLAAAVGSKESALLALPGILGVPLIGLLVRRRWRRLAVVGSAVAAFALAFTVWLLAVALPNRTDLRAATRTFGGTTTGAYPHTVGGAFHRMWRWISHPALADHAVGWSLPLLIAAAVGVAACCLLWRRAGTARLYLTLSGLVWAAGCWAVPVLSGYSPNRYLVIAVPGLALAAGPGLGLGLEWATGRRGAGRRAWHRGAGRRSVGRREAGVGGGGGADRRDPGGQEPPARPWPAALAVAVMGLLILVPGVVSYVRIERPVFGTNQLAEDQAAVARALQPGAVVFGEYAPEMVFSHRAHTVIPWPQSGLHMDASQRRFGVDYVIADVSAAASADDRATLRAVPPAGRPLVAVIWGPHRLALYRVAPR